MKEIPVFYRKKEETHKNVYLGIDWVERLIVMKYQQREINTKNFDPELTEVINFINFAKEVWS